MEQYESLYPPQGQELAHLLANLVANENFPAPALNLFPEQSVEQTRDYVLSCKTVDEFQRNVMSRVCHFVVDRTSQGFTYSGHEILGQQPYLFVSNHRDITCDAILLEYIHILNGQTTTHVVIGSNLFEMQLMAMMARLNKMFAIGRGGNPREYYRSLMQMSGFLRHLITEKHESAWIAQRNGRTKDGLDRTDPALIKMFAASGDRSNPAKALAEMNIVPVSISYEWEPCGIAKARETALKRQGPYTKQPGEDTQSIIDGVIKDKGRIHFTLGQPLTLSELESAQGNFDEIARILDHRIAQGYHLWPNNYIAHEMLTGIHNDNYTPAERQVFEKYIDGACAKHDIPHFRETLLQVYAGAIMRKNELVIA